MANIRLHELIYFEQASKLDPFDVSILSLTVAVTIEPHHSIPTIRYHERFER